MDQKPKHILLIDDDEDDREIFAHALGTVAPGVQCTALEDARQALVSLSDGSLLPDLIFLDLNMPFMTGQQFLSEIRTRGGLSRIPVIILSTTSHPATKKEATELGATAFYSKPNTFEDLVALVRTIVS